MNNKGFIKSLLTIVKSFDPKNAAINAIIAITANNFHCILIFFKYCEVAKAVPVNAGTFSDPIIVATG